VYLTDGEGSGVWPDKEQIKRQRVALSDKVCSELKIPDENVFRLHLPDGHVPLRGRNGFDDAVKQISDIIDAVKPDAFFATSEKEYWPYDHVACAQLASEAIMRANHKTALLFYWVWAVYNLRPWRIFKLDFKKLNRIDISNSMDEKEKLADIYLKAYTPEGKPWSGVLPDAFLKMTRSSFEIIEKPENE
jgi:LmbE family N-acetylglucosaminyl deacetylase